MRDIAAISIMGLLAAGCGTLPRDPENTLGRVQQNKILRVGLMENPPWVIYDSKEPRGAEVQLVRDFASELGAQVSWFSGSEQKHMEALEHFELDLAIGGLEASTLWAKKVGLTRPYFKERFVVGVPANSRPPDRLKGLPVAVKSGDALAALLVKKDASPVRVSEPSTFEGAVAAPEWRLRQLGLRATGFELQEKKHVIATPPGENRWLQRLQEFLDSRRQEVPSLLQQTEAAR